MSCLRFSPVQVAIFVAIILHPDASKDFHGRNLAQKGRGSGSKDVREQGPSISSNGFGYRQAAGGVFGEGFLLDAVPVAVQPLVLTVPQQPVTRDDGQTVESGPQGFSDTHEAVNRAHFGQDMGGVGALSPACFEPSLLFA